jgi:hypothetical protein
MAYGNSSGGSLGDRILGARNISGGNLGDGHICEAVTWARR